MGVTNRVYKVLVTTGGASAANIASVTAGKYTILKKDGTVYTAGQTISNSDTFQIVVGDPAGQTVFSDPINVKGVTSYQKQVYRARIEQVITVTTGTPIAGVEYSLLINDLSDKEILPCRQNLRRYSYVAVTGDTASTVATAFQAAIAADNASTVTAAVTGAAITLTAKSIETTYNNVGEYYPQYFFNAELSAVNDFGYFQAYGTVVYTTAADFGSGNFDQVRTLEQYGLGYTGITNRMGFPIDIPDYLSVLGTTYDIYTIESTNVHESGLETLGRVAAPVTTIVAIAAGQGTAFEAILSPLIESAPFENLGAQD